MTLKGTVSFILKSMNSPGGKGASRPCALVTLAIFLYSFFFLEGKASSFFSLFVSAHDSCWEFSTYMLNATDSLVQEDPRSDFSHKSNMKIQYCYLYQSAWPK